MRDRTRFVFTSRWEVAAPVEDVSAVLLDLGRYPLWWPQVRAVARIDDATAWLVCRSVLPYDLDLIAHATSGRPPFLEVALSGDLDGFARFELTPTLAGTVLEFRQEVTARGVLAAASYLLRPVLAWNHRRMMLSCVSGLRAVLGSGPPPPR